VKDDSVYLQHILDAIAKIEIYTANGREIFDRSPMAQDAVIRNFEIIGEATKRLSTQVRQQHPEVPWRVMAGFRDVLIHEYEGVDVDEVWNVILRDLPELKMQIETLLR